MVLIIRQSQFWKSFLFFSFKLGAGVCPHMLIGVCVCLCIFKKADWDP